MEVGICGAQQCLGEPPDVFVYSIPDYPLHLKPWNPGNNSTTAAQDAERRQQKRTREFFRFVRNAPTEEIQHDTYMSNGESVGAASLWHIHHQHERRTKHTT